MGIHGDDGHEVLDPEVPDRLGGAEVHPVDAVDPFDRGGTDLCGAADGVEVDRAVLLASGERLLPHPTLSDHSSETVIADDLMLIRLLARGSGRAGSLADPLIAFLHHHRAAVVEDR